MATPQNTPYISLPGNAGEAFAYYRDTFGGELEVMTYDEFPDLSGFPFAPPPGAVAHGVLTGGLLTLAGGDSIASPGQELPPLGSDVYSFLIGLDSVEEAKALIEKVTSTGGRLAMPFELAPWGDHYGQVTDPFGVLFAIVVAGAHG